MIRDLDLINNYSYLRSYPIYLYGAGDFGSKTINLIKLVEGIENGGFIDINPAKQGKYFDGIIVENIEKLKGITQKKDCYYFKYVWN